MSASRNVTVIGSTGLVGSQLVRVLAAAGHNVIPVSRESGADLLTIGLLVFFVSLLLVVAALLLLPAILG